MYQSLHYPVISLEATGTSGMIGLVFISAHDIFLLLHEGEFHQIPVYSVLRWALGEKGLAPCPQMNRLRSSLFSVTLLLTSSCEEKKVDSQASPEQRSTACVSLSLCVRLCVFSCRSTSPLAFHPLLSSFSCLTFSHPPSSSLSGSLNPFSFSSPFHLSLSSECLCNAYSYLLVGARIRAPLLMCSCSPRGRGDRENILKS